MNKNKKAKNTTQSKMYYVPRVVPVALLAVGLLGGLILLYTGRAKVVNYLEHDEVASLVEKGYYDNFIESGAPEGRSYSFPESIPSAYYLKKGFSFTAKSAVLFDVCKQDICKEYNVELSRHKPAIETSVFTENALCGIYYDEINRGQSFTYDASSKAIGLDGNRSFNASDVKVYDAGNNCDELGLSALEVKPQPLAVVYFDSRNVPSKIVAIKLNR